MDIEYIKKTVGRHLSHALTEVAIRRPERPVEFLAYYLISLHEAELRLKKEKSPKEVTETPFRISSDVKSNTEQIVASILSDLVDKSAEQYDPMPSDVSSEVVVSTLVEHTDSIIDEKKPLQNVVIGSDTDLDEKLTQLIIDDSMNTTEKLVASAESLSAPSVYETESQKELANLDSNSDTASVPSFVYSVKSKEEQNSN